jgi:hypothetical protein
MKKIQLKLETLQVASFETVGTERGTGTVLGHEGMPQPAVGDSTLSYLRPCFYSEQPSCPIRCT